MNGKKPIRPKLQAKRTISHPVEEARVIGFTGRDKKLGRNAAIMKGEEMDTARDDNGETFFALTEAVAKLIEGEQYHLYILSDDTVYTAPPNIMEHMEEQRVQTGFGEYPMQTVPKRRFNAHPRSEVEVE